MTIQQPIVPLEATRTSPVDLSIIIVSWNTRELLLDCLTAIKAATAPLRVETIAVNACHFAIPDNEGVRPLGGQPIAPGGPAARMA